ncbi:MAG: glycine betaine/L-proline ABC transporter ATP-binding protein [Clostridiales bacterium]|nr:glycine betaine/L-proline ABC transporter ATP-binding protein [Clostridiales bacterium]
MVKLEVKNLYKVFGPNPRRVLKAIKNGASKEQLLKDTGHGIGVRDANFEVLEGEVFVIMGLSGSGKSTLVRCINRLIEPTSGDIILDGQSVTKSDSKELLEIRRKKIGMVFQNFALLPHRTIKENVAFGLEIQAESIEVRDKKATEALEMVGLKGYEDMYPSQLSGGMQQRVGLARALATDPDILLMDEAFSALDPLIRKEMQSELMTLQSRMQKTIIFITHDLDEALRIGDRIAIMKDGEIMQIGTPEEILTDPADNYVKEFVQDVNRAKVVTASSIMKNPDTIISSKDGARVAVRRMRSAGISSIFVLDRQRKLKGIISIEDAMKLVKEESNDIDSIIDKDVYTVSPDTSIEELLPLAVNTKYPIVVADEEGVLQGIIVRVSVLSGILGEEEDDV